jgi:hypothetical protein
MSGQEHLSYQHTHLEQIPDETLMFGTYHAVLCHAPAPVPSGLNEDWAYVQHGPAPKPGQRSHQPQKPQCHNPLHQACGRLRHLRHLRTSSSSGENLPLLVLGNSGQVWRHTRPTQK